MALMAIFNALVHRSTNRTDLVVVTPVAGREHAELESLIGLFANVLPLRTDLTGDPSFLHLLARVHRGTTSLFAHQHVPIQRLQAALRPEWTGARMAMSSLLFALQNVPHDDLRLRGADVRAIESGSHAVFEDLSLFASEDAGGALVLLGLGLFALGLVGAFFGRLIQAAVSRQREYLADASAVQFTRNPDGIGGALKKIGGLKEGSRINNPRAAEVGHMFIADAFFGRGLAGLLATHPPLDERIARIDVDPCVAVRECLRHAKVRNLH